MIIAEDSPDIARVNRQQYFAPELPDDEPGLFEAAFRQENDIVNALALLGRPKYEADSTFDYEARAKASDLFINHADSFVGVQSDAEWFDIENRIRQEQQDRAVINAAGLSGIGASILAGVVSPTVLLPAGLGSRAASIGEAAFDAGKWALIGVGAQEAILQSNQEIRTTGDSAISIGSGVVIASVLGGAIRAAFPRDVDEIASRMDTEELSPSIQYNTNGLGDSELSDTELTALLNKEVERNSAGAAVNPDADYSVFQDAGELELHGAGVGWIGPITRQANSSFPTRRSAINQLSSGGIQRKDNSEFIPTAEGGDLETRKMAWQANLAQVIEGERQSFYDWYKRTGKGGQFRGFFARSSMEEFNHEIGRAIEMRLYGGQHTVPEVSQAADNYINNLFAPIVKAARDADMPAFRNLTDREALRIAHQKVKQDMVFKDRDALRQIVREHTLYQLRNNAELLQNAKVRQWLELDSPDTAMGSRILTEIDYAQAAADKIVAKWEGSFNRHGTATTLNEIPIPKELVYIDPRFRSSAGHVFGNFLERNIEKVARSYTRAMAGDIEVYKRFGTVTPEMRESANTAPFWTEIEREFNDHIALIDADESLSETAKQKARAKATMELKAFERDFEVGISRLRSIRGNPDDPRAIGFRAARILTNLNTVRLMGSVAISSVPDVARLTLKFGFMKTFRDGIIPILTDMRRLKIAAREARYSGASLDVTLHGRSNSIFDLFEDAEYGNAFERGLQTATNYIGSVALFDYWNQSLKSLASSVMLGEISEATQAVAKGTASKKQKRFLAGLNLNESNATRIWKKMTEEGGGEEVSKGVWFPNTEDWGKVDGEDIYDWERMEYRESLTPEQIDKALSDEELARVFRAAIARSVTDTIITPGIERPNWVDTSAGARIIAQFRSFGLSSTLKTSAAAAQDARYGNMGPVLSGIGFSLALGAVSYYIWAMSFGPNSKQAKQAQDLFDDAIAGDDNAMGRIADEAIARSGLIGVLEEVRRVAERVPATRNAVTFGGQVTSRSPFERPITELLGPTVGLFEDLDKIAINLDEPTNSTFDAMRRLTPYQNVFWLRRGMEALFDGAAELAGAR